MAYAQFRYGRHGEQIVEVIDRDVPEPLVRTYTLDRSRTKPRVLLDVLCRRWTKPDRDIVLDTVRRYGWLPAERVSRSAQIFDVIPLRVCPKCQGYLMVGGESATAVLCAEEYCGWTGRSWADAQPYNETD